MAAVKFNCPTCGTELQIEPGANPVTCHICGGAVYVQWLIASRIALTPVKMSPQERFAFLQQRKEYLRQRWKDPYRLRRQEEGRYGEILARLPRDRNPIALIAGGVLLTVMSLLLLPRGWGVFAVFALPGVAGIGLGVKGLSANRARRKEILAKADVVSAYLDDIEATIALVEEAMGQITRQQDSLAGLRRG